MKIVINAQYGGFNLSMLAEQEYLKRKGKEAYFYASQQRHSVGGPYKRISPRDTRSFVWHTYTIDLGEFIEHLPDDSDSYLNGREIPRDDLDLVAVVEQLGDAAGGSHATLAIVEIPDGVEWEVVEYDGYEHVAEKHRCWYAREKS